MDGFVEKVRQAIDAGEKKYQAAKEQRAIAIRRLNEAEAMKVLERLPEQIKKATANGWVEPVDVMAVDSEGLTDIVYEWCQRLEPLGLQPRKIQDPNSDDRNRPSFMLIIERVKKSSWSEPRLL